MLSVWPTSFPMRLPTRGSHMRTTRSGPPETTMCPCGSTASAYIDDLAPEGSGGVRVMIGLAVDCCEARERSQSLTVRSKEPDAIQPWSRLARKGRE
jgi:hypothetical protein